MALFPLEEVHFHLNEGGSPKRVVSRPCVCEMCWLSSSRVFCTAVQRVPGLFLQIICKHQPLVVFLLTTYSVWCLFPVHNLAASLSQFVKVLTQVCFAPDVIWYRVSNSIFIFLRLLLRMRCELLCIKNAQPTSLLSFYSSGACTEKWVCISRRSLLIHSRNKIMKFKFSSSRSVLTNCFPTPLNLKWLWLKSTVWKTLFKTLASVHAAMLFPCLQCSALH